MKNEKQTEVLADPELASDPWRIGAETCVRAAGGMAKILTVALLLALLGCAGRQPAPQSRLYHIVLCWLKEPGNLQHRQEIIEVSRSFREIPGVLAVHAGSVLPSDRGIVDDSFDVAIIVVVPDTARLAEYLIHPIHHEARDNLLLPLVERFVVYDFTD